MSARDLLERLRAVGTRPGMFSLCAQLERCWLGKSPEGRAALLVPCTSAQGGLGRAFGALVLRFVPAVAFDVEGRSWSATSAVVECLDEALLPTFISLAEDVAETLGAGAGPPPSGDVIRALANWELLLRSRPALSEEEQIGLWGELCFIAEAPSVDGAIRAWSPGKRDIVDFVYGGVGIELKAGGTRFRHSLSHHQSRAGGGELRLSFASLWVLPDAAGRSLSEMVEMVTTGATELVALEQKLLRCGFSRSQADLYSRRFSKGAPLALLRAADVPRVTAFDAGVSSIRYTVELDPARVLSDVDTSATLRALCGVTT